MEASFEFAAGFVGVKLIFRENDSKVARDAV